MSEQPSSIDSALQGIKKLYTDGLAEHGRSSKSVGWKDEGSQLMRFDKLALLLADERGPYTVNDWGCGYGAMFDYLAAQPVSQLSQYTGFDISEQMLSEARQTCQDPRATFVLGSDVDREADYTFVSGTFNVRLEATEAEWQQFIQKQLITLAECSRKGLAFNLLTTYVDWKQENLYYADPAYFFDFCKRHISRYVTLVHDYPLYEWTILVKKAP